MAEEGTSRVFSTVTTILYWHKLLWIQDRGLVNSGNTRLTYGSAVLHPINRLMEITVGPGQY